MVAQDFLLASFRSVSTRPGSGGPCLKAAILVAVSFSASWTGLEASHVVKNCVLNKSESRCVQSHCAMRNQTDGPRPGFLSICPLT
ncbi:hypothetical protein B0T10DRAFT_602421, partial [Thelonectria olida]